MRLRIILTGLLLTVSVHGELTLDRDPNPPPKPAPASVRPGPLRPAPPTEVLPAVIVTAAPESILRLRIKLRDGSLVVGMPEQSVVSFQSSLGVVKLKLLDVHSIQITNVHAPATVRFRNGDQLRGTLLLKALPLETSFGKININLEHIAGIEVVTGAVKDTSLNLVLSYEFDEREDDQIINRVGAKHAALKRGANWTATGKHGGGMQFRGRPASLEIPNDAELNFGRGDFSCAVWFQADDLGGTQQIIDHKFNPELQIEPDGKLTVFYAFRFCGRLHSKESIEPRAWYFVVFTRTDGTGHLYVNGVANSSADASDCDASQNAPWTVGRDAGGSEQFRGTIDDLRIWRRALTAEEIQALHEAER